MSRKTINRWYTAIIYQDDTNKDTYIDRINKQYNYVTFILHDKDLTEEGEIKKPHYHYLFYVRRKCKTR